MTINEETTIYQSSQHLLLFRVKFKINVVINGCKTKYQCSQLLFLVLRKVQNQCRHQWRQNQININVVNNFYFFEKSSKSMSSTFLLFRKKFRMHSPFLYRKVQIIKKNKLY
jgi:hypothetical protein